MTDSPTPGRPPSPWEPAPEPPPDLVDAERTEVIPVLPAPEPGPPGPRALATPATDWPAGPGGEPTGSQWPEAGMPVAEPDIARLDPRDSSEFQVQLARLSNRMGTDLGLLLLRWCSLPLILHGLAHLADFNTFAASLAGHPVGATSPTLVALLVVAGQLALPVLLALGLGTRLAALTQLAMMAAIHLAWVLYRTPVLDPHTGVLSGEASLAYAALALPLVFSGAGRVSIDHALGSARRERRAERRAARRLPR